MPVKLLVGIKHALRHQSEKERETRALLIKGQFPDTLFFGCSDSRVVPDSFTRSDMGSLFTHRNIGNTITPVDDFSPVLDVAATIEYALLGVQVSEIVICGHSDCGAMKGLLTPNLEQRLLSVAKWLSPSLFLVENLKQRHPELDESDPQFELKRLKCLTQDNILLQLEHLKTHLEDVKKRVDPATRERLDRLKIHGWYYDIATGEVSIYNQHKDEFISFEKTVDLVALEKLEDIVAQEALDYFMRRSQSDSADEFFSLFNTYREIRFARVSPIWTQIELQVRNKLKEQIGELYLTEDDSLSPLFDQILSKGPAIRLKNMDAIYAVLKKSPSYGVLHNLRQRLGFHQTSPLGATPVTYRKDQIISRQQKDAFTTSMSFSEVINTAYEFIVGNHYDNSLFGSRGKEVSKGVLDFTLLPLMVRKLLADVFSIPEEMGNTAFMLSLAVSIPIELGRFALGISLAIVLMPIVAILHFAKEAFNDILETNCFSNLTP